MNGEGSVHIDRGQWLYRFVLGPESIAIYRSNRAGQDLASPDVWRALAQLGVTDAFVLPIGDAWQPFVELAEGRDRWALEKREVKDEAVAAVRHFLASLAEGFARATRKGGAGELEEPDLALSPPPVPAAPPEPSASEAVLAEAVTARESAGWELVYSRQRALR